MQARIIPVRQGWGWIMEGLRLWRRNPALLIFASFSYLLLLIVLGSIPFIGQIIAYLIMPVMSLGVLNVCRAIDEGRKAGPDVLFSGFRSNVQALVTIGGIYFIGSIGVLTLTALFDGGALMSIVTGMEAFDPEAGLPELGLSPFIALALSIPVLAAYWFAPVLAGWWRLPAPKAMFFSFYACLQNWRPFLLFGLSLFLLFGMVPRLLISIAGMVSPLLANVVGLVLPLVLIPVIFASFYANARDVFGFQAHEHPPLDKPSA